MRTNDYEYFKKKFKPIKNTLHKEEYHLFETYGEELEIVKKHYKDKEQLNKISGNKYIWTLVDYESKLYLIPGFCFINRLNYLITEVPYKEGQRDLKY
jgi:hypothetical protein